MKNVSPVDDAQDVVTKAQLDAKQPTLVSGTNIKTINGNSLLGAGDLAVSGGSTTSPAATLQGAYYFGAL